LKHRLVHLDFLRGLAALLVCISHLSAFLFIPCKQIISPGILVKGFYFLSSLGHQAVLLFFVLSGYLVGGSVIKSFQLQRWSWRDYLLRRMTRLWVVLIPALLLTFFLDWIGSHLNPAGYQGNWHQIYGSGPETGAPESLGANTFLGNLFFLQTIFVPVYGSNSPLWSIANEFWYYLLFPLLISVFLIRGVIWKVVSMLLVIAILFFLPRSIICQGFAWVLGAAVFYLQQKRWAIRCFSSPLFLFGSIILAGLILVVSRMGMLGDLFDPVLGLSFVPLVAACSVRAGSHGIYIKLSAAASEFSYTLYLVHFPIMAFLFFIFMPGRQLPLNPLSIGVFSAVLVLVTLYASAIWWCFERRTDNIRNIIESYLLKNKL
jgi:peptidoglycan/LPS O-acetylase OafA/YrhL